MKSYCRIFLLALFITYLLPSCKKDAKEKSGIAANSLVNFAIQDQLVGVKMDTVNSNITIIIPYLLKKSSLKVNFSLINNTTASINNREVKTNTTIDFSNTVAFKLTSENKKNAVVYNIKVINNLEYMGLGSVQTAGKSLNKSYNFYIDQFDGSNFAPINCGPSVVTMALKWADSTFVKTAVDARNTFRPQGGWWYTSDIISYLNNYGINNKIVYLSNTEALIKQIIDNNYTMIICLDMYYAPYNSSSTQHTNKFYVTESADWGHFLLIKGYKQVDSKFYLEIHDPYSNGSKYLSAFDLSQIKGNSRYYASNGIKQATDVWWPYAIVIAPKGKNVILPIAVAPKRINSADIPVARGR